MWMMSRGGSVQASSIWPSRYPSSSRSPEAADSSASEASTCPRPAVSASPARSVTAFAAALILPSIAVSRMARLREAPHTLFRVERPDIGANPPSRRVLGVELDVLVGQIAGPERAPRRPQREAQPQIDVPLALQIRRGRGGVEGLRHAFVVEQHVPQPQRQLLLLERHPGVPGRAD